MVTHREPQPGAPDPDDDPTGVRALLGSLPDPGPMPDDLARRISASTAAEQERRSAPSPGGTVHPLRRRSPWRALGVAAAAAVVVGVGGAALFSGLGGSPGTGVAGAFSSAGDSAARAESAGGGATTDSGAPALALPVAVHHTERDYTGAGLAVEAAEMAAAPGATMAPLAAETPSLGPIATPQGALACLSALSSSPASALTVDLGTIEGVPAAVLVVTSPSGRTAYAVERRCSTGQPALLAGPVALP